MLLAVLLRIRSIASFLNKAKHLIAFEYILVCEIRTVKYKMVPSTRNGCCGTGPRKTPLEAMNDPPEKVLYALCLQSPENSEKKAGYIATVDADPSSPTYSTVLHRLYTWDLEDELHHFGWNSCVSCTDPAIKRRYLIVPSLKSGNIYIVDTIDQVKLSISKQISGSSIAEQFNLTYPHTVHCIPSGQVMISYMGDAKGNFVVKYIITKF